jgi:hypothetical protein
VVGARLKLDRRLPDACRAFLQVDGPLLPVREIAHQLHAPRGGRGQGEGLFSPVPSLGFGILCMIALYHVYPSVSESAISNALTVNATTAARLTR